MIVHVLCELALFVACLWAALGSLRRRQGWALLGFALLGLAALLGALVYAGLAQLEPLHHELSNLAGRLALLLIAIGGASSLGLNLAVIGFCAVMLWVPDGSSLGVNLLALLAIARKGRSLRWPAALAGAVAFAATGLLVGTRGDWFGVARVDLFHLGLALAVCCWARAELGGLAQGWSRAPGLSRGH
ncbi:hypothetical protein [Pseudomonas citronellolis]|uniref:hypothetical protein n=1 Tax=Pseudomonas citronellolis TaxID=53408 RepID=UPI0023E3A1D5|nr:hypothetical protein [Pseudomonas citronellolis]MDF3936160.1 hypothetical protein [Pseudomonas citronellolis]